MDLKRRLILSNAAIVIIPVLVTIAASFAFFLISSQFVKSDVNLQQIERIAKIKYEFYKAEELILKEKPENLLLRSVQQSLVNRLTPIWGDVVIQKKNEIVFSSLKINDIDLEKCVEAAQSGAMGNIVDINGTSYTVKLVKVSFGDGSSGRVVFLAPFGQSESSVELFIIFIAAVFLISFISTNAVFSLVLSQKILKPLKRLQLVAGEISQGNLEQEVFEEGDNEIRELCQSFEQMRLKLKESVYTQMKYDDNRKMLVSSISHDLKTPITSIKGYVEGIIDGVANTPEKVEKYLKTVYSKAVQVDAMIDDLLLYSKLDLNQIPFHFEKTDLVKYFEDCITEIEPELEKSNIHISLENHLKTKQEVMMDRDRVRRVVTNILDNARKYMNKPQGEIRIILRETATTVVIETRDNGSGISKKSLPHVFDRFYRADASRSKVSGSGLGLAIAKQIIEGHGGKIWVTSQENEGTRIMISFKKL